jgi:hypothetical protein
LVNRVSHVWIVSAIYAGRADTHLGPNLVTRRRGMILNDEMQGRRVILATQGISL